MICPNCDGMLSGPPEVKRCQACGWKTGDPFPAHRVVVRSDHPLKPGANYPEMESAVPVAHVDVEPAPVVVVQDLRVAPGFNATVAETAAALAAPEPEPEKEPIADPLTKTVQ